MTSNQQFSYYIIYKKKFDSSKSEIIKCDLIAFIFESMIVIIIRYKIYNQELRAIDEAT